MSSSTVRPVAVANTASGRSTLAQPRPLLRLGAPVSRMVMVAVLMAVSSVLLMYTTIHIDTTSV